MAKKYQLTQDGPEVQDLLNKVEGLKANQTPGAGETPTALETLSLEGVLYSVVTKAVSDLVNYYTKSEVFTKEEVQQRLSSLVGGFYVPVPELPEPSADTFGLKIYLVPSPDPKTGNLKDEYITVRSGSEGAYTYAWEQIGSTAINLSGYVTTEALNAALANYTTTANLTTLLAAKQDVIADLSTIRTGAAAGATAYQKPSGGVPESDLASSVQTSLSKADTAIQPAEFNELEEEVGTIGNGAYEEAWDGSSAPVVADIPAGVSVTYNSTSYTGTLEASASTVGKIYLVSDGNGNYDRYVTVESSGTYSWKKVGTTAIPLSDYATKAEVSQLQQKADKIVIHHTETINKTGDLAVNSGGQTVAWNDINLRPGRKYSITVESDTDNTGYFRFTAYETTNVAKVISSNINQNINGNPYTFVYEPEENLGVLNLYIRGIATAGHYTATIVEEWDEVKPSNDDNLLEKKVGKNLADPGLFTANMTIKSDVTPWRFVVNNTPGTRISGYIPIKAGQTLVCNVKAHALGFNNAALFKEVGDVVSIAGTGSQPTLTSERTITNSLEYDAYAVFVLPPTGDVQIEVGSVSTAYEPYSPLSGYNLNLQDYAKKTELQAVERQVEDLDDAVDTLATSVGKVVTHHTETITETENLEVATSQRVALANINFRPGRKYTIVIESDTDNTDYFRITATDVNNQTVYLDGGTLNRQNINGNPFTLVYTPTENLGFLILTIRGIAVAGTVTFGITEEWDEVQGETAPDVLTRKPGKNLADPTSFVTPRNIYVNPSSGASIVSIRDAVGHYISGYIPIKNGQTLVCNQSAGANVYNRSALFKEVGDLVPIEGTMVRVDTDVVRAVTNELGYDAYIVFLLIQNPADVQVEVGSTPTYYEPYNAFYGYSQENQDLSEYGPLAPYYGDEINKVNSSLENNKQGATKLHFVHLSDNHGGSFGNADVFTDPSPASFLVNTGDLVADKFSDTYDTTKGLILAMTKPGYVTLGNHDCYNSTSLQARFEKFIEPLNTHNGLTGNTKTYYSVDFATEQVKCIFLDMNDGYGDVTGMGMNYLVAGKMSSEQINWFATELQSAKTNGYDVAVFIHISPDYVDTDRKVDAFYDAQIQKATGVSFLCDMVDGFINGGTVSFTADEVEYSFTFVAGGKFAGWFCGHTHYDSYGWLKDHPKQFSCSVARPFRNTDVNDGTYRIPKLGVVWDYVTINAHTHTMSILRMGNNETIYGTMRDAFYIKY